MRSDSGTATPRLAAALVLAQGLVLVGLGIFLVARGFGADTASRGRAETGGLLAVAGGAGLMLLGRAVARRRHWARSPTLVVELLILPVAVGLLQGHKDAYGVPLLAGALLALVLLGVSGAFAGASADRPGISADRP